jgi:hypothetical protein
MADATLPVDAALTMVTCLTPYQTDESGTSPGGRATHR